MFKPRQFKLDQRGSSKILGELEAQVMEVVWNTGCSTVRAMCDRLKAGKSLSFNTLMTIMNRLVEKGLLKKKVSENQYCYFPVFAREQFFQSVSNALVKSLIKDPAVFSLASFVDKVGEDPKKLAELKKLIDQKWNLSA